RRTAPITATTSPPNSAEPNEERKKPRFSFGGVSCGGCCCGCGWSRCGWSSMTLRMPCTVHATLKPVERFSKDRSVKVFAGLVGAGQLARLQLRVGSGHQRAADQH